MLRFFYTLGIVILVSGCSSKGINISPVTNDRTLLKKFDNPKVKIYMSEEIGQVRAKMDELDSLIASKRDLKANMLKQKIDSDIEVILLEAKVRELREKNNKFKAELNEFEGGEDTVLDDIEALMRDEG